MTTAYNPAAQFHTETLRDAAIAQLADALDDLRIATEKRLDNWNTENDGSIHEATQRALAVAQIVVRRHQLLATV